MDFRYSTEQTLLRDTVSKWAATAYDRQSGDETPADRTLARRNWSHMAALGLLAAPFPEECGGVGGGALETAIIMEEFGKALVLEPFLQTVVLAGGLLRQFGASEPARALIPQIASGEQIVAFAHSEPASRYNLAHVATRAEPRGDNILINGVKCVILGAPLADRFLISVRTGQGDRDRHGVSLFLVEKDSPGLRLRSYRTHDGQHASDIELRDVRVRADCIIGELGAATPIIERIADEAVVALCAEALGVLRVMHALTLEYAKTRIQFGHAIGEFQVIQHKLVDAFIELEEAASISLLATLKLDADPYERARTASAAKVRIGRALRLVGQSAVQIHGGVGAMAETPISRYFKRATMIEMQLGDANHHLDRYIALTGAA